MTIVRLRSRRPSHGQALVEFALVIPLILLLFMGVFDFGRYIYAYNAVSNAAREGARTAIVNQYPSDIVDRAAAQATALGISTASSSCPISGSSGVCVQFLTSNLSATCSTLDIGCVAVVTVKDTVSPITPIIGSIIGSIAVSSTSQQPIESVCSTSGCPVP